MKKIGIILFFLFFAFPYKTVFATTYYMSLSGNDANTGSESAPWATFANALQRLKSGDTLLLMGGTYIQSVVVNISGQDGNSINIRAINGQTAIIDGRNNISQTVVVNGSYVTIQNIEVKNSTNVCVDVYGNNVILQNLTVHDCTGHGIQTRGKHTIIENNTVYLATKMNSARSLSSGWGSGIKVKVGAEDTMIRNNKSYHNYGEGITVTRGIRAVVMNNEVYDNFAVNIYIDNSRDVLVEKNISHCSLNSGFERDGHAAHAYAIGEEYYDGWGAQLANITIRNNIAAFCYKSMSVYSADVLGGGLDSVEIANNTFWGSASTSISMEPASSKTQNSKFVNNIIYQANGQTAWISDAAGILFSHNFWSPNLPNSSSNALGSNDKFGNPLFAGIADRTPSSYRLTISSPPRNSALVLDGLIDDFEGKPRISAGDNVPDIGAYEYSSGDVTSVTPTSILKLGDANADGKVDGIDYVVWVNNYGLSVFGNSVGDFNNNGKVDGIDYVVWVNNYGI